MSENTATTAMDTSGQTIPHMNHPSRQTSLNLDTLVAVMPWIRNRKDLLSFIACCSDLYIAGVSALLGFHCVIKPRNLSLFHRFLISKSPSSFLGLRSLHFYDVDTEDSDVTSSLADIIGRAKNLQHIEIWGNKLHPTLSQALASLPSLCSLNLRIDSSEAELRIVFTQLHSPLSDLKFDGTRAHLDVIAMLSNFHHTLKKLDITRLTFCHNSTGLSYANLVHLSLQFVGSLQLSILVPAFPGLQTLFITLPPDNDDDIEEYRESNIRFQVDHPSQIWRLSSLTGESDGLYMLGLQTVVPGVRVVNDHSKWDPEDIEDCLATLRPMKLSIYNGLDPSDDLSWLSDAIATNCNELVQLGLAFTFPSDADTLAQHQAHLDSLFHELNLISFSNPNLSFLCIEIYGEFQFSPEMAEERNLAHDFLDSLDIDSFAARAVQAIPTLKIAELELYTMDERVFHWNFEQGGGNVRVPSAAETGSSPILGDLMAPMLQAYHSESQAS